MSRFPAVLVVSIVIALVVGGAPGARFAHADSGDCHGIHGDTDNWNDPTGWSCGKVPTDNAVLSSAEAGEAGGAAKVIDGSSVSINQLTLDNGSIEIIGGSLEVGETLNMKNGSQLYAYPREADGPVTAAASTVELDGDSTVADSNIVVGGDPNLLCSVTNTSDFELDDGGSVVENTQGQPLGTGGGSFVNHGDVTAQDATGEGITFKAPLDNEGTVEAGTGTFSVPGPDAHHSSVGGKWVADTSSILNFYSARTFSDGGISGPGTVETSANIVVPATEGFTPDTLLVGAANLTLRGTRSLNNFATTGYGELATSDLTVTKHLQLGNGGLTSGVLRAAAGSSTTVVGMFTATGSSTFHNAGTVQFRGGQLGASGARLINDKGGTYSIDEGGGAVVQEQTSGAPIGSTGATFVNNGLLLDTALSAASLNIPVQLGGTVQAEAGTLVLGPQPADVTADTGHIALTPDQTYLAPIVQFFGTRIMKTNEITGTGEVSVAGGSAHLTIPGPFKQPTVDLDAGPGGELTLTGDSFSFDRLSLESGIRDGKAPIEVQDFTSTGYSTLADGGTVTAKSATNLLEGGLTVTAGLVTNGQTTIGTGAGNGLSTIRMSGGSWTNTGNLSITAVGDAIEEYTGGGPLGSTGATFTNLGKLLIDPPAASTASFEVDTQNRGTIYAERGTTAIAELTGDGQIHALSGATFTLDAGQSLTSDLTTNLIYGPGTIASPIHQDVTVQGPVQLAGAWTMTDLSTAAVTLGATTTHAIQIGSGATLDGTLAITVPTRFAPKPGTTYTLLQTNNESTRPITGTFTTVTGLSTLTAPYRVIYTPTRVYLQF